MIRRVLIPAVAIAAAAFHLYAAGVAPFTALVQRPVHLALMSILGFLGVGVIRRTLDRGTPEEGAAGWWLSGILGTAMAVSCLYLVIEQHDLVGRIGTSSWLDLAMGGLAIVVLLELTRRTTGWGLVAIAVAAIGYAIAGPYLPGILSHRGYGPSRLIEQLYLSTEGIWGIPLGVSADFVYLFVLFGTVLEVAGGGALLINLASRLAGRMRGGPAITASVASAFMGSLSGSAVANVVTTGSLTIPVMKRSGFKPHFAAAVEAAASTAGQIMPPVMGAGAFILATWTGIPYVQVALAALVPALLYYVALVMAIRFRAAKMGLPHGVVDPTSKVLPRLHLLLPVGIIVAFLATGASPMRAAFWGVVTAFAVTLLRRETRLDLPRVREALVTGAASTVQVACACATAGIVVGVASLTGIGLRLSELIITMSLGQLPLALLLTALASIVLGMGLPTTAAYVVLAALGAPALTELGVPTLAAHLFVFYFGCMSNLTPPVALAAFAAAGIAGASAMQTAMTAVLLAGTGFLVPFMFVYGPPLLLVGSPLTIAFAVFTAVLGVTSLAAASMGYLRRDLRVAERLLLAGAALVLIYPGLVSDAIGITVMAAVFVTGKPRTPDPARLEPALGVGETVA